MRRREFIALVGGAATFPVAARAQQQPRLPRVGVLINLPADDPETQGRIGALAQGLQAAGWTIGRNVRVDYRVSGDQRLIAPHAEQLLAQSPDVVLVNANPALDAVQRLSRTTPIVFVAVTDPVGSGFVQTLSRPGGNATGFTSGEFGMSGKWVELLKEIAPSVQRIAVLQDGVTAGSSIAQFAAMQAVAPSFRVELVPIVMREPDQIEQAVTEFAHSANAGLIATRTGASIQHRDQIVSLAARYRLPAVYPLRLFTRAGGLLAYGPDLTDEYRQAATYIGRILKGEKPAELPVQEPTKFEMVVNLKTAKALGLNIPQTLLATADEVIE